MKSLIRTLIIEDEPAVRAETEWLVGREQPFTLLGVATNVQEALVLIRATRPDLVLLDIQLTDGSAFDILDQLEEISFRIIFITAYNDFALKAIKYGAFDYLLKPLDETELRAALQRVAMPPAAGPSFQGQQLAIVQDQFTGKENDLESRIVLHTLEYLQVLQLKEIEYCRSEGGYTHFFLTQKRKILISKPLKFYDELLPEQWFLRPHQSYLVNIQFVDKFLKNGTIIMKDKTEIPVSVRRKEFVLQQINQLK